MTDLSTAQYFPQPISQLSIAQSLSQPSLNQQQPLNRPPMAQPPMAQPPMAQPPMAQPPMAQPPMAQYLPQTIGQPSIVQSRNQQRRPWWDLKNLRIGTRRR
ncbi:hypothetical protein V8F20_003113 [Naviculisporaceae sp. PSN 640]